MASRRLLLRVAACGLAAGSAVALFSPAAVGKSHTGGDAEFWEPELPAKAGSDPSRYGAWDANWDQREASGDRKSASGDRKSESGDRAGPTRHLFLVRHAQPHAHARRDEECTLTARGRRQAELTGRRLAGLGLPFCRLVHSPLARAAETADIIAQQLPGVATASCDLLREGFPVAPEPPLPRSPPDAARQAQDRARLEAAFRRYVHRADAPQPRHSYELLVCHANVIRYLVCRALQFPPQGWARLAVQHGSITHLLVRPDGHVVLRALGDTGFMPPDLITCS